MAFVINVAHDVGQTIHYITKCQGLPDNAELITVRTSIVEEVRTLTTDVGSTNITYFVLENNNTVQVEETDAFSTLTDATNELNARLTTTPQ